MQTCPKCNAALSSGFAGSECPTCGVIFAKFYAARDAKEQMRLAQESERARLENEAAKRQQTPPPPSPQTAAPARQSGKTASCPACGGLVAIGAANCPHCGQAKPAPKKVGIVGYAVAGVFLVAIIVLVK